MNASPESPANPGQRMLLTGPVRITLIAALAALALYTLAGFFLVPKLLVSWVKDTVSTAHGLRVEVGRADFNPYTFAVSVTDITVFGPENLPFVSAAALQGHLQASAILRRNLSFADAAAISQIRAEAGRGDLPMLQAPVAYCKGLEVRSRPAEIRLDTLLLSRPRVTLLRAAAGNAGMSRGLKVLASDGFPRRISLTDGELSFTDTATRNPLRLESVGFVAHAVVSAAGEVHIDMVVQDGDARARLAGRWPQADDDTPWKISLSVENVPAERLDTYVFGLPELRARAGTVWLSLDAHSVNGLSGIDSRLVARGVDWHTTNSSEADSARLLAVALLQDPQGVIDLSEAYQTPPGFRLSGVDTLFVRLFGDAAEAGAADPFAHLSALAGWQGSGLGKVEFEPGSAQLSGASADALRALGVALAQRPGVGITVWPGYDSGSDGHALARKQVAQHINLATSAALPGSSEAIPVDMDDEKVRSVLEEFAENQLGASQLAAIAGRAQNSKRGYYAAIFDALIDAQRVPENASRRLARFRAQTILRALRDHGVDPSRLEQAADTERPDASNGRVPLRLSAWPVVRTESANPELVAAPDS